MNVQALDGSSLNFWVAKAAGLEATTVSPPEGDAYDPDSGFWHPATFEPSSNWSQGGPFVSAEWFALEDVLIEWFGPQWVQIPAITAHPLKWFMRAYIATQYGNAVEDIAAAHHTPNASSRWMHP
jgi:hypothetical protein